MSDKSQHGEDGEQDGTHVTDEKMPPYNSAKRKVSKLLELMNGGYLDLEPHYQRGVIWNKDAMSRFIESMIRGYYVPPVVFNLKVLKDNDEYQRIRRTCVDGKQRLISIRDFLRGNIPCKIDGKPFWFCENTPAYMNREGRRKLILGAIAKQEFMKTLVLCIEYRDLSQRQETELFQRVQLGKQLSQAESFRAKLGSWQNLARLYEEEFSDVIKLVKQSRASGFIAILQCFSQIYECHYPSSENGKPKRRSEMRAVEYFVLDENSLTPETKSHLRFVFDLFHDLVVEDRSTFGGHGFVKTKAFSLLELIAVCCLLSQKGAERTRDTLRGDILHLRRFLRANHSDLRLNDVCWDSAWSFIDGLEEIRAAADDSTIQSNTITTSAPNPETTSTSTNALPVSTPSMNDIQGQHSVAPSTSAPTVASNHPGTGNGSEVDMPGIASTHQGSVSTNDGFGQTDSHQQHSIE